MHIVYLQRTFDLDRNKWHYMSQYPGKNEIKEALDYTVILNEQN